jgi:trk system potassium uptake protein TrkH
MISFVSLAAIGTVALYTYGTLSHEYGIIDSLLVAVSLLTGTGISTIPLSEFTLFGKILLIVLIYLGSIGVITLFLGVLFSFSAYSVEWYKLTSDFTEGVTMQNMYSFLQTLIIFSLLACFSGSFCFFIESHLAGTPLTYIDSFFLAINFFCNVGFNYALPSYTNFFTSSLFYFFAAVLSLLGSLGFLFFFEIKQWMTKRNTPLPHHFSLTTKLISFIYFATVGLAWIGYFITCEKSLTPEALMRSLFAAVSLRSCGISPYTWMPDSVTLLSAFYSIFGTAPLGTGGGLKTTIIALLIYTFISFLRQENKIRIKNKILPWEVISFAQLSLFMILFLSFIITIGIDFYISHQGNFLLTYCDVLTLLTNCGCSLHLFPQFTTTSLKLILISIMLWAKIIIVSLIIYGNKIKKYSNEKENKIKLIF